MKKSWRTSLSGIFTGVVMLIGQIQTLLDSDPLTNPEYTLIMAGIGAIAMGLNARDEVVSSEEAGLKK